MPIVFAGIAPHPPLLIPSIGKNNLKKVAQTADALKKLEEDLYLTKPDTIIIISPHGSHFSEAFTININPSYESDLRQLGDLTTKLTFKGDAELPVLINETARDKNFPIACISEKYLDHGAIVPLYYLTKHLNNVSVIPIGFCDLDWKTQTDFGYMIKELINADDKRVAVIASGDLSHALMTDAPAGYNPAGEKFDQKIQELLASGSMSGMIQLDKQFVSDAAECGFRSFLILMGILRNVSYTYRSYSYEAPFGVGYLVANFVL